MFVEYQILFNVHLIYKHDNYLLPFFAQLYFSIYIQFLVYLSKTRFSHDCMWVVTEGSLGWRDNFHSDGEFRMPCWIGGIIADKTLLLRNATSSHTCPSLTLLFAGPKTLWNEPSGYVFLTLSSSSMILNRSESNSSSLTAAWLLMASCSLAFTWLSFLKCCRRRSVSLVH